MSTRHFAHDAENLVLDSLESLTLTNPTLRFDKINKDHNPSINVTLIAGGGAGHEPAHAGYVGEGLLTAAISGSIFASPNVSQIVNTIARVGGKAGTILVIMNYTGDVFHFHLAAEKARANYGVKVEIIVVGDDVSVGREKSGKVGRRGLAGTVLVNKILGAMNKKPAVSFEELTIMGKLVASNLVTVGASLGHVHIPGREIANGFSDPKTEQLELGMGIHNESGSRILSPQPDLHSLIDMMLDQLLSMDDPDRAFVDLQDAEEIVLLVNNLGGVSVLELGGITKNVVVALKLRNITISRVLSGTFMTSLDGPGFSITLLKATSEMVEYIDAPTSAVGWCGPSFAPFVWENQASRQVSALNEPKALGITVESEFKLDVSAFKRKVSQACKNVIAAEPRITHSDTIVGDGDCGTTLSRGAEAVLDFLNSNDVNPDALITLLHLANVIEDNMDGTSGAIYSIFFAGLASSLRTLSSSTHTLDSHTWGRAAKAAMSQLQLATPARKGDRTLMDALEPFIESFANGEGLEDAVAKAKSGVEATKGMKAAFGRAVYVEEKAWAIVPDPGAEGVLCLLEGLAQGL
ncbi:Dihydroxyacetone kinase [Lachnellula willkommii]|uniref:Dihydroxyacetone kinase n=1 Tax=Lachnellula willkommii TaxID=215461 RepID=A0A559MLH3_9HELO|nr:Dihydroxyacetone kinase [Lachnellula willkommii]